MRMLLKKIWEEALLLIFIKMNKETSKIYHDFICSGGLKNE
jgi:hypothetical protein